MRSYTRPIPWNWWLSRRPYLLFILREATSIFVGAYGLLLLLLLRSLAAGPEAFAGFLAGLRAPAALLFQGLALAAALYHTVTWLAAMPMATPVRVGGRRVPAGTVIGGGYAAWVVVSLLIAWIVLWA